MGLRNTTKQRKLIALAIYAMIILIPRYLKRMTHGSLDLRQRLLWTGRYTGTLRADWIPVLRLTIFLSSAEIWSVEETSSDFSLSPFPCRKLRISVDAPLLSASLLQLGPLLWFLQLALSSPSSFFCLLSSFFCLLSSPSGLLFLLDRRKLVPIDGLLSSSSVTGPWAS